MILKPFQDAVIEQFKDVDKIKLIHFAPHGSYYCINFRGAFKFVDTTMIRSVVDDVATQFNLQLTSSLGFADGYMVKITLVNPNNSGPRLHRDILLHPKQADLLVDLYHATPVPEVEALRLRLTELQDRVIALGEQRNQGYANRENGNLVNGSVADDVVRLANELKEQRK